MAQNTEPAYLAVDLGAGSGRVILGRFTSDALELSELHRWTQPQAVSDGHERWVFADLLREIETGLTVAGRLDFLDPGTIRSVGVDGWGVDSGLLDAEQDLIGDPVCYRDPRTDGLVDLLCERIGREAIYRKTGIQFLSFNTLVQLFAQVRAGEWPANADRLLMVPDLVHLHLSGVARGEFTNATTTQMLDATLGSFDPALLDAIEVPIGVMPELVQPGTRLGPMRDELRTTTGLANLDVVVPATHDTGSAVAGTPLTEGWAYLSSGTWSLLGVETNAPVLSDLALQFNLTNEGGVYGSNRLLKNVMGLWILESCREVWGVDHDELLAGLSASEAGESFLDPDDLRFLHPDDMVAAVGGYLEETGQVRPLEPSELARVILVSLALRYASVVERLAIVSGRTIRGIHIVGGGCQNDFLNQATANATGLTVRAGPVEATAIGNLAVQAISGGVFADLAEARDFIRRTSQVRSFEPEANTSWLSARERFVELG